MENRAAEANLLSGFIRHSELFFKFVEWLDAERDFTHASLQMVFQTIKTLYCDQEAEQISKLKIMATAKDLGFANIMAVTNNGAAIDKILAQQVSESDTIAAFKQVQKASFIRGYESKFVDLKAYMRQTDDPVYDMVGKVEETIYSQTTSLSQDETIVDLAGGARDTIMYLADSPGQLGLDVGMTIWQSRIGQIRNGSITFIVATAKTGKSQLGLKIALNTAKKGIPVFLADSELNETQQRVRLVGMYAGIPYNVLETGYWKMDAKELSAEGFDDDFIAEMADYRSRLEDDEFWDKVDNLPISYASISGKGMDEVIPILKRWLLTKVKPSMDAKFPECLLVYDYIKLAHINELKGGKMSEWQIHGLNVAALHDFAQQYNVPVITFGQTNREIDDSLDCVAGAKRIIDNVDSISLLKRKSDTELPLSPNGNYYIRVFEARHGKATHGSHINYQIDPDRWNMEERDLQVINFREEYQKKLDKWKKKKDGDFDDDEE